MFGVNFMSLGLLHTHLSMQGFFFPFHYFILQDIHNHRGKVVPLSVNTLKGAMKYKVEVFSKVCIWHMAFMCWSIFLIFTFSVPSL